MRSTTQRRRRLIGARSFAAALALGGSAFVGAGCPVRRAGPTSPPPSSRSTTATSSDAVLRDTISVEQQPSGTRYHGQGWTLTVDPSTGWQRVREDTSATLLLTRETEGVVLDLALKAYAVRSAMPVDTFLTAHAMWLSEEGGPRVEYEHDEDSGSWRGYAIHDDEESYYAFFTAGDRAYVLEESATGGVLNEEEVARFYAIADSFRDHAASEPEVALPSNRSDSPEKP